MSKFLSSYTAMLAVEKIIEELETYTDGFANGRISISVKHIEGESDDIRVTERAVLLDGNFETIGERSDEYGSDLGTEGWEQD